MKREDISTVISLNNKLQELENRQRLLKAIKDMQERGNYVTITIQCGDSTCHFCGYQNLELQQVTDEVLLISQKAIEQQIDQALSKLGEI